MWLISKLSLVLLLLYNPLFSFGQEEDQKSRFRKEVKLNTSFRIRNTVIQLGELAPVFVLENNRGIRHEFELSSLGISIDNQTTTDGRRRKYFLALRYQYTYPLIKRGPVMPYIAGAISSGWKYNHYLPQTTHSFESYSNILDNKAEFIPGVKVPFSGRMGIDISFVIPLFHYHFQYNKIDNPYLPINAARGISNELYFEPFTGFHSRLGVYLKL